MTHCQSVQHNADTCNTGIERGVSNKSIRRVCHLCCIPHLDPPFRKTLIDTGQNRSQPICTMYTSKIHRLFWLCVCRRLLTSSVPIIPIYCLAPCPIFGPYLPFHTTLSSPSPNSRTCICEIHISTMIECSEAHVHS